MLIAAMPIKKTISPMIVLELILLALKRRYPTIKLNNAHKTFVRGDESPIPGGSAKGDGKGFPETPFTKCGTTLARKIPEKNAEM